MRDESATQAPVALRPLRDGRVESRVRTPAGTWVRLHGLHDPAREARGIVESALAGADVPPVVIAVGVGLSRVVEELIGRRADLRVLALELFAGIPGALRAAARPDKGDGGSTLVGEGPAFALPVTTWPAAALAGEPLVVVQPIAAHLWPELVEQACRAGRQHVYERRANEEARERLAPVYLENTLQNVAALLRAPDVSVLDGIAGGDPLILCGAGPSLDRLLPAIRACRQRAWLVAIDTAVRPLLAAGVVPDLIVSIDPSALNGRHLLDLPVRARPWLVAEPSLDPRAIRAFAGRVIACRLGTADPWPWLHAIGIDATRVRAWGSVLTAACDVVRRMRPRRVAFAAIDLAYTEGQPYCRGTAFEADWAEQRQREGLASIEEVWRRRIAEHDLTEPDVDGQPAHTAPHLVAFRNWVREFIAAEPSCEYANATGAGILHGPGIVQCGLHEWIPDSCAAVPAAERLRAAAIATPPPPGIAAAVAAAVATDVAAATAADEPWHGWQARVPRIERRRIAGHLEHAAREMRAREGAAAVNGSSDWIDVPYDPTHFFSQAPMAWEVAEGNVGTFAYRVDGKTMTLSFKINHSTLAGEPSRELYLRLPAGHIAARGAANAVWIGSRPVKETGYATVHPGHDFVVVHRSNEEPFPLERDDFFLFGQLLLEVQ